MFGHKKQNQKNNSLNFESDNYKMKDNYKANNLVVANLEFISSEPTPCGPMVHTTTQKYIFEMFNENGKIRYRELFTGFIADSEKSHYFELPYIVNIIPLQEQIPSIKKNISKYNLLLVLDEVNTKEFLSILDRVNTQKFEKVIKK